MHISDFDKYKIAEFFLVIHYVSYKLYVERSIVFVKSQVVDAFKSVSARCLLQYAKSAPRPMC